MEWAFTQEDVVKGKVAYGMADFRADLFKEVRLNMPDMDGAGQQRLFDLIYDMHYWLATGRNFDAFIDGLNLPAHVQVFLGSIEAQCAANVSMLGAILQRAIMDGVESGLPLEQSLAHAANLHAQVVAGRLAS